MSSTSSRDDAIETLQRINHVRVWTGRTGNIFPWTGSVARRLQDALAPPFQNDHLSLASDRTENWRYPPADIKARLGHDMHPILVRHDPVGQATCRGIDRDFRIAPGSAVIG